MKRMFLLLILLFITLLNGCNGLPSGVPVTPTTAPNLYKAVYFTNGPGELTVDDLEAHPEVILASTYDDFKSYTGSKIALWVDKNAVPMVDDLWITLPPQKYYPLVLLGYNDALYCFRDFLDVRQIEGPVVDWSKETLEPGFCVWMLRDESDHGSAAVFKDYRHKPDVQEILDITNPLLEEVQDTHKLTSP